MALSEQRLDCEWLEADGLGGFASGTVSGIRTRRYHALLLAATQPPAGRMVLVNGFDAWIETAAGHYYLTAQRYAPDVIAPDGPVRLVEFRHRPWPTWRYQAEDGTEIEQELVVPRGRPESLVRWRVVKAASPVKLYVRPFLSGRDYHVLHRENPGFNFLPTIVPEGVIWRPYAGVPAVIALSNGRYSHEPLWYRNFLYEQERQRGLDCVEDLAAPGTFSWDIEEQREAVLLLRAEVGDAAAPVGSSVAPARQSSEAPPKSYGQGDGPTLVHVRELLEGERNRRQRFRSSLEQAAEAYIVRRGAGQTIVAGYPWFTDWGRDTFIAIRGLCGSPDRLDMMRDILLAWADTVSEGMLPNRFPDSGSTPEYNSVDASLWYVIAVHDYLQLAARLRCTPKAQIHQKLREAVEALVSGYAAGTRYGIRMDADGLLACGVPGVQLTWMDAKVGDWVLTPRIGKPVEVQALWLNAMKIAGVWQLRYLEIYERGVQSFRQRFWCEDAGCLYDVVDVHHVPGRVDASFRPNQIFAVGGLPYPVLDGAQARLVVDAVESRLLTPMGLRSLAASEPGYRAVYGGGVWERDSAYHQGTVWPWLMGAFIEAWLRVRGSTSEAGDEARRRFLQPLIDHVDDAGLGHVSEIADAQPPHVARGCPFQAWSLGELLRSIRLLEAGTSLEPDANSRRKRKTSSRAFSST